MGAPVHGEDGAGDVLKAGYFLPSLHFDADELEALCPGAGLVAARGDGGLAEAARRAAAKISGAAGPQALTPFAEATIAAGSSGHPPSPVLEPLHRDIRDRRMIRVDYLSLSQVASTRLARPVGLTLFDSAWLLTLWSETAQDFRHLRADRITALTVLDDRFRSVRGKRLADSPDREGHARFPAPA